MLCCSLTGLQPWPVQSYWLTAMTCAILLAYSHDVRCLTGLQECCVAVLLQLYWLTGMMCCNLTDLQGAAVLLVYRGLQFHWQSYWLTGCSSFTGSFTGLQGAAVLMNYKVLRFYWLTGAAVLLQSRWLTGMQRCGLRGLQRPCRSNVPERWQDRGRIEWTCCPCVTPGLSCKGYLMSVMKGRVDEQDVSGITSVFDPSLLWIVVSFFFRSLSVSPPGWFLLCV